MNSPCRSGSRGNSKQVVSLEKARKIARQRDQLAEKLETLRQKYEELAEAKQQEASKAETLEQRLENAEARVEKLREALDEARAELEARETSPEPAEPSPEADPGEIERLEGRVAELNADLERLRARSDETADEAEKRERMRLLAGLGDVLDSVERGLEMEVDEDALRGLEGIRDQLVRFLTREGAELVGEVGEPMDPTVHEAVERIETDEVDSGCIADVDRRGLVLEDGTVVRPARVSVAR